MKPPPARGEATRRSKRRRHRPATSDVANPRQQASSGEEYRVGPGHPPREYQFKPGQSGNPDGAKPKKSKLVRDLRTLFERALNKKVNLRRGERAEIMTKDLLRPNCTSLRIRSMALR